MNVKPIICRDGKTIYRVSRWLKIHFDTSAYFQFHGRRYRLDDFHGYGICPIYEWYNEDGRLEFVSEYQDMGDNYRDSPLYLEIDDGFENVRVYVEEDRFDMNGNLKWWIK